MAGLPARRAWVSVGPPLSARGPSLGSVLDRSPEPERPQVPSLSRLFPLEVMTPLQSPPETLSATMQFCRVAVPPLARPPPTSPVLPLTVTLVRVAVLPRKLL